MNFFLLQHILKFLLCKQDLRNFYQDPDSLFFFNANVMSSKKKVISQLTFMKSEILLRFLSFLMCGSYRFDISFSTKPAAISCILSNCFSLRYTLARNFPKVAIEFYSGFPILTLSSQKIISRKNKYYLDS